MIRYDSSYNQEINRVVSNFNRKVRRLEKEERELLPTPVKVQDLKEKFTNRRDLNIYLNELRRFSKRGAEEVMDVGGKKFTRYQVDIFKRRLRRERTRLTKQIKAEESVQHRYPMQHAIYLQNLRNRRSSLGQDWEYLITTKNSEKIGDYFSKLETYENYFEVLFQDAYMTGFSEEKIRYIKEKLSKLSPDQFVRALENTPEIQYVFEYYHSLIRQGGIPDKNANAAYQALYEKVDSIVEQYS